MVVTNPFMFLVVCSVVGLIYNIFTNTNYVVS